MDREYIKSLLQNILNSEFKVSEKKRINDYQDRFNFACCYCQDSSKHLHLKRGNLYLDKLFIICFNCGKKTTFDKFLKDFNQQISPDRRMEMIKYLDENITHKDYENDINETSFENLLNLVDVERIFNSGDYAITDFRKIEKNGIVYNYLNSRGISEKYQKDIFQAKYWYNSDRYENVICILNRRGSRVLGMQIRNLKGGKKRMFKIYNFESLYKWINNVEEITDIDINQLVIYNKISYYFNILNIDFGRTITIFEGYLDSLFYPNSIGVVGTNTDMKFLEKNNLYIQYMYDNDISGFKKSEEKIKIGFAVFLWNKLFGDIVDRRKSNDPHGLLYRISKIKDLNSLSEIIKDPYSKLKLSNYFSNDIYDIKYIPKIKSYYDKRSRGSDKSI